MNPIQALIESKLDCAIQAMAWAPGSRGEMTFWQERLRDRLFELLGGFDEARPPLAPQLSQPVTCDGCLRSTLTFASRKDYRAFAYFLEPHSASKQGQVIVCIPGHGKGVDAIVGLAEEPYQAEFALQCVRKGYRVLAIEPFGFGHRCSLRVGQSGTSCDADAKAALLLGETLAGWRIWDAMRAVDYLQSRGDVNGIGIIGISGGGMTALWTAALDPRISAAVVSGYFCTFRESILSVDHCLDNFVPGVLNLIEMPDFAGLVAPRALFVESGSDDPLFPVAGFRKAVHRAKGIYDAFEAPSQFGFEEFAGDHHFHGSGAFEFLERAFHPAQG